MSWRAPKVTVEPVGEPITVDIVHARCHIDSADDDADIVQMIATARDHVERYCGLMLMPRTVELTCDSFADFCLLPVGPVTDVSSIAYVDAGGAAQLLADGIAELTAIDEFNAAIDLKYGQSWPAIATGSRLTVTVIAGFGTIPPAIIGALLLYIADSFETRENAAVEGATAFDNLLCNYRR